MLLVTRMLAESGPLHKHEIRTRLRPYSGTIANSGINYLLLTGKIVEYYDGTVELTKPRCDRHE
jgi:hypothetical protein